ncbi:MAG: S8 family serine peptidase, partial [bacterium]
SSATVSAQTLLDDNQHFLQAGTSMAAPFVAGTIALMFQANPNFTGDDVEGFITQSAYADPFVGTAPNDRWGYGKLDILKAMEIAVNGKASGSFDVSGSATLPKDDSSGSSGGCSMASPVASQGSTCVELFLVAIGACAIAAMRRRVKIGSGIRSS